MFLLEAKCNILTKGGDSILALLKILRTVLKIMQIAIPIILIIFGTLDLGKAIMAGKEQEIKDATSILVKRAIAAVAVFLLFTIVELLTGLVGSDSWKTCWEEAADADDILSTGA